MPKYYYVVDTGITSTRNGESVAVGQTTYNLLLNEKFEHGVYPETAGPGAGTTWAATDSPPGTQIGIHTTQKVGIGGTALADRNLQVHGSLGIGVGVTVQGGIVTAINGYTSGVNTSTQLGVSTTPIQITLQGNVLSFYAVGIGSTNFTLHFS